MSERTDERVAALVQAAEPAVEPAAGWEERAVAAMEAAGERGRRRRQVMRRALIAASAGAMVCLLIGGVAVRPALTARDILSRALEAVDQASTMHVVGQSATTATFSYEQWSARDGLVRQEKREGGELAWLRLFDDGWETTYSPGVAGAAADKGAGQGQGRAAVTFEPLYEPPATLERSRIWWLFRSLEDLGGYMGFVVEEGPTIDVVQAEGTATLPLGVGICGAVYDEGDHISAQVVMDHCTGRLLRVTVSRLQADWQLLYEESYGWDEELPEWVRDFEAPAGTLVTRRTWWAGRYGQTLATGHTRDWEVTIHALDLNREGDILLSMSRRMTPESQMPVPYDMAPLPEVEATDDAGGVYEETEGHAVGERQGFGYEGVDLKRKGGGPRPSVATFHIHPYPDGVSADQAVTLTVPLPPRQEVEDPFDSAIQEVQY
jgi:hypothetical protein